MKTIVGIATPQGAGGIGIIRISGEDALDITSKMFSEKLIPRHATLGQINGKGFKDTGIAIYFQAPNSYTGEDVVEIQSHGGYHLVNKILETAISCGATLAEPGEFTKTALLNGKMTLSEAENIIDIINAESDLELTNSTKVMSGELHNLLSKIQEELISIRAEIYAYLDYPEDLESPDIPVARVHTIIKQIENLLSTASRGQIIKNGIKVAFLGEPNAGKSSIFNALLGDNRSIVTNIAGTTTDIITETILHKGIKINFIDTAGLRKGDLSVIEQHGIDRTKTVMNSADILLIIIDATTMNTVSFPNHKKHIKVYNKSDLVKTKQKDGICVSAKTKANLDKILDEVVHLAMDTTVSSDVLMLTNKRHITELEKALNVLSQITQSMELDKMSADITTALEHIGKITGADIDERTLDEIFSKFCLGK